MIIRPCKRYDTETWVNPTPFILEARDLGIVHDIEDPETHETFTAQELHECLYSYLKTRIEKGLVNACYEIEPMATNFGAYGLRGSHLRYTANRFIERINQYLQHMRGEAFAYLRGKEGWELECDICQNTVAKRIYDEELAMANQDEVEREAIKLHRQMVRNGELQ